MTVFVTYRLADALPSHVREAYRQERRTLDRVFRQIPDDIEVRKARARLFCERIDRILDGGSGSCALRNHEIAQRVMDNLHHHDGSLYRLVAAVIMPNHVHVLATLKGDTRLERVTHAWKSYTGKEAVKLGFGTPFWQDECYDHIFRNEVEYRAYLKYILENPVKAGLKDWPWIYQREELEMQGGEPPHRFLRQPI